MNAEIKIMRDVFIEEIYLRMRTNEDIFFLSADFGSPKLDRIRAEFRDRFINVGIAEQNLINVATGLALEGFVVFAYAIAPFLTMRAFEQIRNNLSLQSQVKKLNVNLIGVGAGLSYDVSGPTHHCLEDLIIMRALPGMTVFSPSDWVIAKGFVEHAIKAKMPKYLRFDGKPISALYEGAGKIPFKDGFKELRKGEKICLVSTGFMTHRALKAADGLLKEKTAVGIIDVFLLKPFSEAALFNALKKYRGVITIEEGFIHKGGLDAIVSDIVASRGMHIVVKSMGFDDAYVFETGNREYLHALHHLDEDGIIKNIRDMLRKL